MKTKGPLETARALLLRCLLPSRLKKRSSQVPIVEAAPCVSLHAPMVETHGPCAERMDAVDADATYIGSRMNGCGESSGNAGAITDGRKEGRSACADVGSGGTGGRRVRGKIARRMLTPSPGHAPMHELRKNTFSIESGMTMRTSHTKMSPLTSHVAPFSSRTWT